MSGCHECRRLVDDCDCDVMMLDKYGTEIVPGEQYIESSCGEVVHKDNAVKYLLEDVSMELKTR